MWFVFSEVPSQEAIALKKITISNQITKYWEDEWGN